MATRLAPLAAILASFVATTTVHAQTRFFGEDKQWALNSTSTAGTNSAGQRQLFLNSLIGVGTESFESFAAGSTAPLNLSFSGAGTALLRNSGSVSTSIANGRQPTDGTKYWRVVSGGSGLQFGIKFSDLIAAFGVYAVDVGDFGDQLTLAFFRDDDLVDTWSPSHGLGGGTDGVNDGNLNFFGYINTNSLFDEIRFSSRSVTAQTEDVWGFDQMTIGSVEQVRVPEPSSLALLGVGLAVMAWRRRRTQLA